MTTTEAAERIARAKRKFLLIFAAYVCSLIIITTAVWAASSIVWAAGVLLALMVVMPWVFTALRITAQRRRRHKA